MSIYIASDHRGVSLKEYLYNELSKDESVVKSRIENTSEDDYPDFAFDLCSHMSKENDLGIVICGTGIGISIAANKVKGIRCARVLSVNDATLARQHNHANVIALPADMEYQEAFQIVLAFINAEESNEDRHVRRVNKITMYENGEYNEL